MSSAENLNSYQLKYLKYKFKYINLLSQLGGTKLQDNIDFLVNNFGKKISFDEKKRKLENWLPNNSHVCSYVNTLLSLYEYSKEQSKNYYFEPFISVAEFINDIENNQKILIRLKFTASESDYGGIIFSFLDESNKVINIEANIIPGNKLKVGKTNLSVIDLLRSIERQYEEAKKVKPIIPSMEAQITPEKQPITAPVVLEKRLTKAQIDFIRNKLDVNNKLKNDAEVEKFVSMHLPSICASSLAADKGTHVCTPFIENVYELWNSPIFVPFPSPEEDIESPASTRDLIVRLSASSKMHFVVSFVDKKAKNTFSYKIGCKNDGLFVYENTTYQPSNFLEQFADKFPVIKQLQSYKQYLERKQFWNKKASDYSGIDKVVILTLQFIEEGGRHLLPNINQKDRPGYSSLIIEKVYKERAPEAKTSIILNSQKDRADNRKILASLTNKSRLIVIGHCCKDGQLTGVPVKSGSNPPLGIVDILNLLIDNTKINNMHDENRLIISIYACEGAFKFCQPLSLLLYDSEIAATIKCRSNPVVRLGFIADDVDVGSAMGTYVREASVTCHKPKIFFNRGETVEYHDKGEEVTE